MDIATIIGLATLLVTISPFVFYWIKRIKNTPTKEDRRKRKKATDASAQRRRLEDKYERDKNYLYNFLLNIKCKPNKKDIGEHSVWITGKIEKNTDGFEKEFEDGEFYINTNILVTNNIKNNTDYLNERVKLAILKECENKKILERTVKKIKNKEKNLFNETIKLLSAYEISYNEINKVNNRIFQK